MSAKLRIWNRFCDEHQVEDGVSLFSGKNGVVDVTNYGSSGRPVLKRSAQMERVVVSEVAKVISDFEAGGDQYDGLIYMMFWSEDGQVLPLYIGKTEKYGKSENLSANIRSVRLRGNGQIGGDAYFARWGYNRAYHLGDLSGVVLEGHRSPKKYLRWASQLFEEFPTQRPKLTRATYFWCKAWDAREAGIWEEFGPTNLTFLEYLLIGVASDLFPQYVLNNEGVNR